MRPLLSFDTFLLPAVAKAMADRYAKTLKYDWGLIEFVFFNILLNSKERAAFIKDSS